LKKIAPDPVNRQRSRAILISANANLENYENQTSSRRHRLHCEPGFFHVAQRANDAQEVDSIFGYSERKRVSRGFASQTSRTIHSISRNDFRSRPEREDVHDYR